MDSTQTICPRGQSLTLMDATTFFAFSFALHLQVQQAEEQHMQNVQYSILHTKKFNLLKLLASSFSFQKKITFPHSLQNSCFDASKNRFRFNYFIRSKKSEIGKTECHSLPLNLIPLNSSFNCSSC